MKLSLNNNSNAVHENIGVYSFVKLIFYSYSLIKTTIISGKSVFKPVYAIDVFKRIENIVPRL